jgi:SH3-like domain-containing protein
MRSMIVCSVVVLIAIAAAAAQTPPPTAGVGPASGKPLPRFESIAATEAFGRRGPGFDHRIDWLYRRPGLPVEVVEEARDWRRIRDPSGETVWMHASRLGAARTVMVTPRADQADAALLHAPRAGADIVATAPTGVIGALGECVGPYRELRVIDDGGAAFSGWLDKQDAWGAPECPAAPAQKASPTADR